MTGSIAKTPPAPSVPAGALADLVQTLWPAPVSWTLGRADAGEEQRVLGDFLIMPSAEDPRTLLPRRPALASAVTKASTAAHSSRQRIRRSVIAAAMRSGAGPVLGTRLRLWSADPTGADTIERTLTEILGEPVTVGVRLGPPRANRKPVLHILSRSGEVLAIAKLGVRGLARTLVATETEALSALAGRTWRYVTIPRVIHAGEWRGALLLVQSPLMPLRPRRLTTELRLAAMREVATSHGTHRGPVAGSAYADGLAARIDALPDRVMAERLSAALKGALRGSLEFGAWHGDWTEWNTAAGASTVLVWDWERLAAPVPVGFDAAHLAIQRALVRTGGPTTEHALDLLSRGPELMQPFGVPAAEASGVVELYLLELATRYATDNQSISGVAAGHVSAWILPALEHVGRERQAGAK